MRLGEHLARPSSLFIASWPRVLRRPVEITECKSRLLVDLSQRTLMTQSVRPNCSAFVADL
jgi:hypothetical protein